MTVRNEFHEGVKREFKLKNSGNSWLQLPLQNATDIQLYQFELWIMFEKTASLVGNYSNPKKNIRPIDVIEYGITLYLMDKYFKNVFTKEYYVSLNQIQMFLLEKGLDFSQNLISKKLKHLNNADMILQFDLIKYRSENKKCKKYDEYNNYTKYLYYLNPTLGDVIIESWRKEDPSKLATAKSTNLKKTHELAKKIAKKSDIF